MPNQHPYNHGYQGGLKLLTIAIDRYAESPLYTAKNGAEAFRDVLSRKNQRLAGSTDDRLNLVDDQATGSAIREALRSLQSTESEYEDPTAREGGLIIYIAGHAVVRRTRDGVPVGYFVPVDYERGNWDSLIPLESFTEARHFMASKHILYVLDCCFAGSVFSRSMLALQNDFRSEARHFKPPVRINEEAVRADLRARFTGLRAYQVLAAGNYDQPVLDFYGSPSAIPASAEVSAHLQSPFTRHLLGGLNGAAADEFGMITVDSLAIYLRGCFAGGPEDQTPRHGYLPGHDGGDFVLADRQTPTSGALKMATGEPAPHKKGVIVLVSPTSATHRDLIGLDKTQWAGVEHHRCLDDAEITIPLRAAIRRGPLQKLWLLHTPESDIVAYEMERRYLAVEIDVKRISVADAYSIGMTRQAVSEAIEAAGLGPTELIVDVTGGTTPMSIGAAHACQAAGIQMQYCRPNHLAYAGGRPDTTNRILIPVLLEAEEVLRA